MNPRYIFSSLTRIVPSQDRDFEVAPLPRGEWDLGDYVAAEVVESRGPLGSVELPTGRHARVYEGDLLVGAWGRRAATLEVTGSWEEIGDDGALQALTRAGLFGRATSQSLELPPLMQLRYSGHLRIGGKVGRMEDFALAPSSAPLEAPVVLLIGTSMSAGKTTAARVIIRLLKETGRRVVGVKLTGAGRYRDILSMADAGADEIFDFVDGGLPSTVCSTARFEKAQEIVLGRVAAAEPDVVVLEAGASPLEPYNGEAALERLAGLVRCTVLCAADPYASLGVIRAFPIPTDLIAGLATSTAAGIRLVGRLTGISAVNVLDRITEARLLAFLEEKLT